MTNGDQPRAEVLRGTLDLMVFQTLVSLGPSHGYAIAARIERVSDGALILNMGTLYPGLMRLAQRGLVRAELGVDEQEPTGPVLRDSWSRTRPSGRRWAITPRT